jgi:hypothetical protein
MLIEAVRRSDKRHDKTALLFIGFLCLAAAKLGCNTCKPRLFRRRQMTGMAFNHGRMALARRKHIDNQGYR